MAQEFPVNSFERGFTDNYVNGPRNAGEKFDNLLISKGRKPFSRPGSETHLDSKIPTGVSTIPDALRINAAFNFDDDMFSLVNNKLIYDDGSAYSSISTNQDAVIDYQQNSIAQWQNQSFISQFLFDRSSVIARTFTSYPLNITSSGRHILVTADRSFFVGSDTVAFSINVGSVLPTNITSSVQYFPVSITDDTFKLSATQGGSPLTYVDSGSGSLGFSVIHRRTETIDIFYQNKKLWKDDAGDYQFVWAGLPDPKYVGNRVKIAASLNAMKTAFNTHAHTMSAGSHKTVPEIPIIAADAVTSNLAGIIRLANELRDAYTAHNDDAEATTGANKYHFADLVGSTSGSSRSDLSTAADKFTIDELITFINDFIDKYNIHDADTTAHTGGSIATISTTHKFTQVYLSSTSTAGASSYLYAYCYKREHIVGNTTYIDRSVPHYATITYSTIVDAANPKNVVVKEILYGGGTAYGIFFGGVDQQNWGDVSIELYRSTLNGTVLQKVAEVKSFAAIDQTGQDRTIVDNVPDASLGLPLYTTGGVVGTDIPPSCRYIVQANDVGWYAHVKIDGLVLSNRVYHSVPLDPDGVPSNFFVEVDGAITGAGAVGINPIIFTKDKVYRLEGTVDSLGRGFIKKRIIDDTVGCISHNSIVTVKDGLYFAGHDGFYFCDGFKCVQISQHLKESYRVIIDRGSTTKLNIYGAYNPKEDLVYWAVGSRNPDDEGTENTEIWVHDRYWGIPNSEGTFTTWSNGSNFSPTALAVIDGDLYRADSRGYIFRHDDEITEDPIVNTLVSPSTWQSRLVLVDYISSAFNFGTDYGRKYVTRLLTVLESNSTASVQPWSINDDTGNKRALKTIYNAADFVWGDPLWEWGGEDFVWRVDPTTFALRRFPKGSLRCTLKQVSYTNARKVKANSDNNGSVNVNATTKVISLASGDFTVTPDHTALVGGYIHFGDSPDFDLNDGFEILSTTVSTVTVQDLANDLVTGSQAAWVIVNYDEGDTFNLEGYTILYDNFGSSHTAYNVGDDGGNVA